MDISSRKWLRPVLFIAAAVGLLVVVLVVKSSPEDIDRDAAVAAAKTQLPEDVIEQVQMATLLDDTTWTVHFMFVNGTSIEKDDLGWYDDGHTTFAYQGLLPAGTYRLLTIKMDRKTGEILSREASDSFLLGGPGMFNE